MKITAIIRDRETGTLIGEFATVEEAKAELQKYEEQDKADGSYEEDFYELIELEDLKNMPFEITGDLKKVPKKDLVDYLAEGFRTIDGKKIPCEIGFTVFSDRIMATHIFVKETWTDDGTHYLAQTIERDSCFWNYQKIEKILTAGRSAEKMVDVSSVTWKKLMMIPYGGSLEIPEIIKAITDYTDFYTEDDEEEIIKAIEEGYITFEADGIIIWGA